MALGLPPFSFLLRKPPRTDVQRDGNQVTRVRSTQGRASPSCPPNFHLPVLPHVLAISCGHPRMEANQGTLQGRDDEWVLLGVPFLRWVN